MKFKLLLFIPSFLILFKPNVCFTQVVDLGSATSFSVFTSIGAISNDSTTHIVGDIGTNSGTLTGFPPGTVNGNKHVTDSVSAKAASDLVKAFNAVTATSCGMVIGNTLGNGQVLTPNVYCIHAVTTLKGTLTLDGIGNANSVFIFKIDSAFSTDTSAKIILTNAASLCNVYWQINGVFTLGANAGFLGTILGDSAIILNLNSTLNGRVLTTSGAISLHHNNVTVNTPPNATIFASGSTTICPGDSVTLTASNGNTYLWSNGATSKSITVHNAGSYSVTITDACGKTTSNPTVITFNTSSASITANGPLTFCQGDSVKLTANGGSKFLWSTGDTTSFIIVRTSGSYTVQSRDTLGCNGPSPATVVQVDSISTITANGPLTFCQGDSVKLTANGGSKFVWSTGDTTSFIIVRASGSYTVHSTDTSGCNGPSAATVVHVDSSSTITANGPLTFCQGDSVKLTASGGSKFLWSTGDTTSSIIVRTSGSYTVHSTDTSSCNGPSAATVVHVDSSSTITANGPLTFCQGDSVKLTASGGSKFLWSTGDTTSSIIVRTSGSYTVHSTDSTSGCNGPSAATVVHVDSSSTITASGPLTFCQGDSVKLTASGGSKFLWSTGDTTSSIIIRTSGSYTVHSTDSTGCGGPSSATVVQVDTSSLITANGPLTFCTGDSVKLTASGGSKFLWSTGDTSSFIIVRTSGSYTVHSTDSTGCNGPSAPTVVQVNTSSTITANGPLTFCQGDSVKLTASGGSKFIWSNGDTTSSIIVRTSGSYTVHSTDSTGCNGVSAATVVHVNTSTAPAITSNGPLTFCQGGSIVLTTSTLNGNIWSTGDTTRNITVNHSGNYTLSNQGSCGDSSASITVVVNPTVIPTVTAEGPLTICPGGSVKLTSSAGSGYLWSTGDTTNSIIARTAGNYSVTTKGICPSTSAAILLVVDSSSTPKITASGPLSFCPSGSVILTSSGANSYLWSTGDTTSSITVTASGNYTVTTTGACAGTSAVTVVNNNASGAPTISANGPLTFCQGGSVILTSSLANGYLWSTGDTTRSITVSNTGNYSVTTTGTCAGTSAVTHVTVMDITTPTITPFGATTFCAGDSILLTSSNASGYYWSTGVLTQSIMVSSAGNYTVTATHNCGATSVATVVTTKVIVIPTITASGPLTFCQGDSVILTSSIAGNYHWSTGDTTQKIIVKTSGSFTVTDSNSCNATSAITIVTIDTIGTPIITVTGDTTFCQGDSVILTSSVASGYHWSTGDTTQSITVKTSGSYTVTTSGSCGGTSAATLIHIDSTNIPVITANGPLTFCTGDSVILTSSISGNYLWSTGDTTQSIKVKTSGSYTVSTNIGTCTKVSAPSVVTSGTNGVPLITANRNLKLCLGDSVRLTASAGSTYSWSTGDTTRSIVVKDSGSYTVVVSGACSGTSVPAVITVNPNRIPTITADGPTTFCEGGSVNLTANTGSYYRWTFGDHTQSVQITQSGFYAVRVYNECGYNFSEPIRVTVKPTPNCTILVNSPDCKVGATQLCAADTNARYVWSTGDTTQCINITQVGTYSVVVSYASGCTSTCSKTITESQFPNCTITGDSSVCETNASVLSAPVGDYTYLWSTGDTTRTIGNLKEGTYTVSVTNASGCVSTCSKTVSLKQTPPCIISGKFSICEGDTTQLKAPLGGSAYFWSTGSKDVYISVQDSGTYWLIVSYPNGCVTQCSQHVDFSCPDSLTNFGSVTPDPKETSQQKIKLNTTQGYKIPNGETGYIESKAWPNPFAQSTMIEFRSIESANKIKVDVFNVNGQKVATLFEGTLLKNELKQVRFDATGLTDGIYYYHITDGKASVSKKLVLLKN